MSPHAQYKTSNTELGAAKMGRGNKEKRKQDNALLDSMTQTLRQMIKSGEQNFTINGKSYNTATATANDEKKWKDLLSQNEDLKAQDKTLRDQRLEMDIEREAIAVLASLNASDPEIARRSTLLRLRSEAIEIRDRTLARERNVVNAEFVVMKQDRKKTTAQQRQKQKQKQKQKQNQNQNNRVLQTFGGLGAGMQHEYEGGMIGAGNRITDASHIKREFEIGYEGGMMGAGNQIPDAPQIKSEFKFASALNANPPGPPPPLFSYYTDNAPAMTSDTKIDLTVNQGIHPDRLQSLAVNPFEPSADLSPEYPQFSSAFASGANSIPPAMTTKKMSLSDYSARKTQSKMANTSLTGSPNTHATPSVPSKTQENVNFNLAAKPSPHSNVHNEASISQHSGLNFSSSMVTPQPAIGTSDVQNSSLTSSLNNENQQTEFNFSSSLVKPRYETRSQSQSMAPVSKTLEPSSKNPNSASRSVGDRAIQDQVSSSLCNHGVEPAERVSSNPVSSGLTAVSGNIQPQIPKFGTDPKNIDAYLDNLLADHAPPAPSKKTEMPDLVPHSVQEPAGQENGWARW